MGVRRADAESVSEPSSWPPWATEPVHVGAADDNWPARGEQLRREIEALLAPWLTRRVEHIGSTAVPGLPAKPIIDLQAAVADLAVAIPVAEALAPYSWHFVDPDLDQRPWRRFFVKVSAGRRVAHLHVMSPDSPRWEQQLAFREALRSDPSLVAAYATLKRDLACRHAGDREAYTAAKSGFIHAALDRQH